MAFVVRAQSSPLDAGSNTCQTESGTERGAATPEPPVSGPTADGRDSETSERIDDGATAGDRNPRRFYGAVELDPLRLTRDAEQMAEAIVEHIAGLVCAEARVRLEVEADVPGGVQERRGAHRHGECAHASVRGPTASSRTRTTAAGDAVRDTVTMAPIEPNSRGSLPARRSCQRIETCSGRLSAGSRGE